MYWTDVKNQQNRVIDSLEQSFVNQFEEFLTNLASQPGVSLGNQKSYIDDDMKMIKSKSQVKADDQKRFKWLKNGS